MVFYVSLSNAQTSINVDGGVFEKSVSRATKVIDGKRMSSSRIIIESKLRLDISIANKNLVVDDVEVTKLLNGLNQYIIVVYNTQPETIVSVDISSLGYNTFTINKIMLNPKQTNQYYAYDPALDIKVVRIMKSKQESQYLKLANELFNNSKYDEAISEFDKVIEFNIMCDSAYYGKALSLIKQKKYKDAVKNYIIALNRNNDFTEIYDDLRRMYPNNLKEVYYRADHTKEIYNRKELPLYELGFYGAGIINFAYTEYGKIDPKYSDNLILLGAISDSNYAVTCHKKALTEDSDNIYAYYMLGYTYMTLLGDYENAYIAFKNLVDRTDEFSEMVGEIIYAKWNPKGRSPSGVTSARKKYANDGHIQEAYDFFVYAKSKQPKGKYGKYLKIYKSLLKDYH